MPTTAAAAGDRLRIALDPRTPEVEALVKAAILRLAAETSEIEIDMIANAAENPKGVPAAEVARLAGVSYRQLDYWIRRGWLAPVDRDAAGSGNVRHFPPHAVVKARIMGSLVNLFSMAPPRAAEVADEIIATGAAEVGGFRVTRKGLEQ